MSDTGFPLPPPTFEFLVFSLKTQAEMRLGLLPSGEAEGMNRSGTFRRRAMPSTCWRCWPKRPAAICRWRSSG